MQLQEEALFTLKMDGKTVINELGELEKSWPSSTAQQEVARGTKEWAENKAEIKVLEAQIKQVLNEIGVSGMTVKQLEDYYRQLNCETKDLTPGTDAYVKKAAHNTEVNTWLDEHRRTVCGVNEEVEKKPGLWQRAQTATVAFVASFSLLALGERMLNWIGDGIRKALDLSDMIGSVGKATKASPPTTISIGAARSPIFTISTTAPA